ncbi:hypothetical protein [Pseudaminobacter soli (ex Li et al. 2025)]|uniref:Uncharacterized protein n=1 Tax=Pseudaminobacter soli (ex Li et al. 2025) TaxID=1295366 RepID=A0A2P7SDZ7_9HYPH|nr:hypothetical protein [Mesorhizobium soli]PSJ60732.1 hypothetical protein C7I85_11860 [Mesorhizobium soli]
MTTTRALIFSLSMLVLSIGGLLFMAAQAKAQRASCFYLERIISDLHELRGEELAWSGTQRVNGATIRTMLFQSPHLTWTLVVSQHTTGCIIGQGSGASPVIIGRDA